jgi:hypothetical protein
VYSNWYINAYINGWEECAECNLPNAPNECSSHTISCRHYRDYAASLGSQPGLHATNVGKLERGELEMSFFRTARIARFLRTTISRLLGE